MKRRRSLLAVAAVALLCASCVHTQEAIAPATLGDLWIGVEADVEQLVMLLLWL